MAPSDITIEPEAASTLMLPPVVVMSPDAGWNTDPAALIATLPPDTAPTVKSPLPRVPSATSPLPPAATVVAVRAAPVASMTILPSTVLATVTVNAPRSCL